MDQKTVNAIYKKFSNKHPVLEIGAGWWSMFEFDHTCFDRASMINGQKTCANHFGDFHNMSDFKDGTFEFICALSVIEHAKNPKVALQEWSRILKEDGILLLDWPAVGFPKSTPEDLIKFQKLEEALNRKDLSLYSQLGGDMSWVSKDCNGNLFLDAHYNVLSLEEMKSILPKDLVVIEEEPPYGFLILKKVNKPLEKSYNSDLISCIIPVYNQAQYIDETIQSILSQTYQNFEIIIVNDGSTDNLLEVLNKYTDTRIKIINQSNKKLPEALNTGLRNCSGKYITWMSSDSYYDPRAFEVMVNHLNTNPKIGLVSTHFKIFGDREEIIQHNIGIYTLKEMKVGNYVGCCFMFRKECQEMAGYFDIEYLTVEDWKMWASISKKFPLEKIYGVYAYWRSHNCNMTSTLGKCLGVENSFKLKREMETWKQEY